MKKKSANKTYIGAAFTQWHKNKYPYNRMTIGLQYCPSYYYKEVIRMVLFMNHPGNENKNTMRYHLTSVRVAFIKDHKR